MSDQGEKTCPLCAEEMDLTDQQLKPCKCGYEVTILCRITQVECFFSSWLGLLLPSDMYLLYQSAALKVKFILWCEFYRT